MVDMESGAAVITWSVVALAAAVISLAWIYLKQRQKPKVKVRKGGPKQWPVLGSLLELRRNYHRINDWMLSFFSEDVQTFRMDVPFQRIVSTVDPVNVEYILTNIHKYGKGEVIRTRMGDFLGNGFFASDGATWRRHRKIASTEFSTRKLCKHSNTVYRDDAIRLANALRRAMVANKPVEFQDLALRMTLDSICKVAFGHDLNGLSPSLPKEPFAIAFDTAQALLPKRVFNPFYRVQRYLNIGVERIFKNAIHEVDAFADSVINKRRQEIADAHSAGEEFNGNDLLSKFMSHAEGSSVEDHYNDKELRDVIVDFLLAGRDTTGVTLAWFMKEMCHRPEMVENIYAEGVRVVGKHSNFAAMADHLTPDNLSRMHYLHAALSESLRLNPPVPRDGKVVLVDNDVLPDGTLMKKGDVVQYLPYCMARMPFIWGKDAVEFKPERWLKDGVFHSVSPFKYTTFQAGPRICLGREAAYLQLKVTMALIIHFFKFQLLSGQELTYTSTLLMPMKNGIMVTISPRE